MTAEPRTERYLSLEAAARWLDVPTITVEEWIATHRLLAWQSPDGALVIPAEQILGCGKLVNGIAEVIAEVGDSRAAWRFLVEESPFFDAPTRPIDALKTGDIDQVLEAAKAQGDSFT